VKKEIVRVEHPTDEHGLYRVWVKQSDVVYPVILTEKEYKVLIIEQHLTEKLGYDSKALLEYKEAIVSQIVDEFAQVSN
jgi:hypothetical protein